MKQNNYVLRNEGDMPGNVQLTVVHKSELKDLITADTSVDELYDCKDVVATNKIL